MSSLLERLPTRGRRAAAALLAGLLLSFSLPPWGWWPLAFAGIALLDRAIAGAPAGSRFRRGWLAGIGLLAPATSWMLAFTPPGYLIQVVVFGAILGAGVAACPPGRGRWLALPAIWVLFEALKGRWPFGGVPLAELAVGQVGGPLAPAARLGGILVLGLLTVAVGVAISAAWERRVGPAVAALAAVVVVVLVAVVAPQGSDTGETITVALVQGGGEQGTVDAETDDREVFLTHLEASEAVPVGTDLTVWPENVVNIDDPIGSSREGRELAALAREKDTTLVVGVVESDGPDAFRNAAVVFDPEGEIIGRYEKVRRVPFGEFVPFRDLLEPVAGAALPSKDAVVGTTTNTLDTPAGRVGIVISWEVFFGDRARDAINGRGRTGELLLNPTNGSSYTGTLVQTQQVASSRLRAIETGRWELQVAPTGFTAVVTPDGEVLQRTAVSEQRVLTDVVALREGRTPYLVAGVWPTLGIAVLLLAAAWTLTWTDDRRAEGEDGDGDGGGDESSGDDDGSSAEDGAEGQPAASSSGSGTEQASPEQSRSSSRTSPSSSATSKEPSSP